MAPSRWPGSALDGLEQLDHVALRILKGRDPQLPVIRRPLDDLDACGLEPLPLGVDVVGAEAHHVPSGVLVLAMYLAMGAEPQRRLAVLTEHDESRRPDRYREAQQIAIERQQVLEVFTPDRCSADTRDHGCPPRWNHSRIAPESLDAIALRAPRRSSRTRRTGRQPCRTA